MIVLRYNFAPVLHYEVDQSKQLYEPLVMSEERYGNYALVRVAKIKDRDFNDGSSTFDDGRHRVS